MEKALGKTKTIWTLEGDFWSTDRLPMTIFKPFGYSSSRTVLQMVAFWTWFILLLTIHYFKFRSSKLTSDDSSREGTEEVEDLEQGDKLVPAENS